MAIDSLRSLSSEETADLIESILLCDEANSLGFTQLQKSVQQHSEAPDAQFEFALSTISRRGKRYGFSYPFELTSSAFKKINDPTQHVYSHLLCSSPNTLFRESMTTAELINEGDKFEETVGKALTFILGESTSTINFGWPSRSGRPKEFPDAIVWLAEKLGVRVGHGYRSPRRKDGGVDVISWRPFSDGKTAFPVMLTQCTIQRDLYSKSSDIDIRLWSTWLGLLRDPITCLAFPFFLPGNSEEWEELSLRHLILDRGRLLELLGNTNSGFEPATIRRHIDRVHALLANS